ncbi:uncharacterized protein LOC122067370 isoform X2 [Macadamia integrifolia]|uniref:uncharacterized protein LOC122067370 isoform X2 n=1 Tax=Macadamia integrifolia TaxID=60698 RepID=UPI001C4F4664|nr:uncharacterized protein LOC122067370 isoform X2 [Macadamia integrifolia]
MNLSEYCKCLTREAMEDHYFERLETHEAKYRRLYYRINDLPGKQEEIYKYRTTKQSLTPQISYMAIRTQLSNLTPNHQQEREDRFLVACTNAQTLGSGAKKPPYLRLDACLPPLYGLSFGIITTQSGYTIIRLACAAQRFVSEETNKEFGSRSLCSNHLFKMSY